MNSGTLFFSNTVKNYFFTECYPPNGPSAMGEFPEKRFPTWADADEGHTTIIDRIEESDIESDVESLSNSDRELVGENVPENLEMVGNTDDSVPPTIGSVATPPSFDLNVTEALIPPHLSDIAQNTAFTPSSSRAHPPSLSFYPSETPQAKGKFSVDEEDPFECTPLLNSTPRTTIRKKRSVPMNFSDSD